MATPFSNKFFSLAGQKERLANAGKTLLSAVTGRGVTANTGSPTANKILGAAASNPFVTAAVPAVIVNPAAAGAAIRSGFSSLSPTAKIAAVVATPVAIGAVATNPSLLGKAAKAPSELASFGSDIGGLVASPTSQNFKDTVSNSPVIAGALALGGIALVGKGIAGTAATIANTRAVRDNTEVFSESPMLPLTESISSSSVGGSLVPLTPETQVLGKEVKSGTVTRRRKAKKARASPSVRVNVLNQQTYISGR